MRRVTDDHRGVSARSLFNVVSIPHSLLPLTTEGTAVPKPPAPWKIKKMIVFLPSDSICWLASPLSAPRRPSNRDAQRLTKSAQVVSQTRESVSTLPSYGISDDTDGAPLFQEQYSSCVHPVATMGIQCTVRSQQMEKSRCQSLFLPEVSAVLFCIQHWVPALCSFTSSTWLHLLFRWSLQRVACCQRNCFGVRVDAAGTSLAWSRFL